jgi:type I restriction enzyme S subunit
MNVNDRVDDPSSAGVDRYVGLDHLDPGSLKIRRWGSPSDVEATKLRFEPGDLIFGRRRAYQRKLGVAEFEGICSAHALVLRARAETVDPKFLPFLMQSEAFQERAEAISVGSLSPTINWKTLAVQEFPLPPLDEQRRIAEILWAAENAILLVDESVQHVTRVRGVAFVDLLAKEQSGESYGGEVLLSKLLLESPRSGHSAPSPSFETGHYVLTLTALSVTGYRSGQYKPAIPDVAMLRARLKDGDFLISRSSTIELVGLCGIFDEDRDDVSFPDTMMLLSLDKNQIDSRFFQHFLHSGPARSYIQQIAAGTSNSMKKINRANLLKMRVPLPDLEAQRTILAQIDRWGDALEDVRAHVQRIRTVKASILDQLLQASP